ncbi:MAG: transglutaminase domain-containing protein [Vulcanimicrobiota bacterium]
MVVALLLSCACSQSPSPRPVTAFRTPGQPVPIPRVAVTPVPPPTPEVTPADEPLRPTPRASETPVGDPGLVDWEPPRAIHWEAPRRAAHRSERTRPQARPTSKPVAPRAPKLTTLAQVDALALSVSSSTDVDQLARSLTTNVAGEKLKARAIFRWMTAHISYDEGTLDAPVVGSDSDERILKRGTATEDEYAYLFDSLARRAGLQTRIIHGVAKGYHSEGAPTRHTWNAVMIDGAWRLVDCTWGTGFVNSSGRFERRFNPEYFLADPGRMSFTHLPDESRWQLSSRPVSPDEFSQRPRLWDAYFNYGLQLRSHAGGIVSASPSASVVVDCPSSVELTAQLSGPRGEEQVTAEARVGGYAFRVEPESTGEYILTIFAGRRGEKPYWNAVRYRVRCEKTG